MQCGNVKITKSEGQELCTQFYHLNDLFLRQASYHFKAVEYTILFFLNQFYLKIFRLKFVSLINWEH